MTTFYDQDADNAWTCPDCGGHNLEDGPECLGPEGDCTDTFNDPRCPVHGGKAFDAAYDAAVDADEDEAECLGPEGDNVRFIIPLTTIECYICRKILSPTGQLSQPYKVRQDVGAEPLLPSAEMFVSEITEIKRTDTDRRSTARREADRSIITDQAETIQLLEGRVAVLLGGRTVGIESLETQKDEAYHERDQLVAVLSKLWPSHLSRHEGEWEDDWRNIVCIHSPVGQLTWHIHDSEVGLFSHLAIKPGHWDGHTTPEKYRRLSDLTADQAETIRALEGRLLLAQGRLQNAGRLQAAADSEGLDSVGALLAHFQGVRAQRDEAVRLLRTHNGPGCVREECEQIADFLDSLDTEEG